MADGPEIWKNETRHPVGVRKNDPRNPGATKVELVRAGGQLIISAEERKLTEEMVRKPVNNPFRNGWLLLVSGAEDDPELQQIKSDPNSISREEIDKLFEGNLKAMESKLAKIDSVTTIQRILDVADEEGASTRRVQAVRDRLNALGGGAGQLPNAGEGPVMAGSTPSGREKFYPPEQGGVAPEGGATARVG